MEDLIELLQYIGRARLSFVVYYSPLVPPEAICATVRGHIGKQTTVARLRSDAISADESAFIHDALFQNQVLVLIAGGSGELPVELLEAWESFREASGHSRAQAGRFIYFEPDDVLKSADGKDPLSTLVLVVPNDYSRRLRAPIRRWIESLDQLGPPAPPLDDIRDLGRPAVAMSMKTLYFLHHRDPPDVEHHDSVSQIMKGEWRLTWSDLRCVLQQQPDDNMFDILEGFRRRGRLSVEQVDFAVAAIPFIRGETHEEERIGWRALAPSIYHALWLYERLLPRRGCVFRGQRDSRWRQDTTLLRADADGMPASIDAIVQRLHRTQAFLDALAGCERDLVGRQLDDDERLAIAQHYGLPTTLLDYTRSLAIAAFFATGSGDASLLKEGDVGVIYYVSPTDAVAAASDRTPDSFDFAAAAGFRFGRLRTIEPQLPDAENRIARQMGLFIAGFESRDLQRMAAGVLYFRQKPGEALEDPRVGITRARLLTPEAKLQQLASSITVDRPHFSRQLTAARIPGDDILGALGTLLPANLQNAQDFLDEAAKAAERASPGLWRSIEAILMRHLSEARIKARTADISATDTLATGAGPSGIYILDEVDEALEELAALADLPRDALTRRLRRHRPVQSLAADPVAVRDRIDAPSPDTKARVVTAVATFIVGLEYLRTVRGEMAQHYIQVAAFALHRLDWAGGG
jgi:hypothetical protein